MERALTTGLAETGETPEQIDERARCQADPAYFLRAYGYVYDASPLVRAWIPFSLWPAQVTTLATMEHERLLLVLKARQLGLTWLVLGFALWMMLFRRGSTILLFSQRDDDAVQLLDFRLRGMYDRLPEWMRPALTKSNAHEIRFANGSMALAFPTTGGRSYTATMAIVDEADFAPDLDQLMNAVKPTIDAGGKMILISTVDKDQPQSEFKRIYRGAKAGENDWRAVFLPWSAHPDRDAAWHADKARDYLSHTSSLNGLHQEYPEADVEALAPRVQGKRIPPEWIADRYKERQRIPLGSLPPGAPALPGLEVYALPVPGSSYVLGCDPAEGNPGSDDSALEVLDAVTGEEMAVLAGKYEPAIMAGHVSTVAAWYNGASVLVERNNHGHAVLLWLADNSTALVLAGRDNKPGWLDNSLGKHLLYDNCTDAFRSRDTIVHSFATMSQLQGIEGATLLAPKGENDDRSDAYALALLARSEHGNSFMEYLKQKQAEKEKRRDN